ncbi:hypothetical protein DMENIID0001_140190 [Sergentomyia squamirostris]
MEIKKEVIDDEYVDYPFNTVIVKEEYKVEGDEQQTSFGDDISRSTLEVGEKMTGAVNGKYKKREVKKDVALEFKCKTCQKVFLKSHNLSHHKKIHLDRKPFECAHCSKKFTNRKYLCRHLKTHYNRPSAKCNICGKMCKNKFALSSHIWRHTKANQRDRKHHHCSICEKSFHTSSHLKRHQLRVHEKKKIGKTYTCGKCEKSFEDKRGYEAHLQLHSGKWTTLQCIKCFRIFQKESTLKRHVLLKKCEALKPYKCFYCDKSFKSNSVRSSHIQKYHNGLPLDEPSDGAFCSTCGKTFETAADIKRHIDLIDSQQGLFPCRICGKRFLKMKDRHDHINIAHEK